MRASTSSLSDPSFQPRPAAVAYLRLIINMAHIDYEKRSINVEWLNLAVVALESPDHYSSLSSPLPPPYVPEGPLKTYRRVVDGCR